VLEVNRIRCSYGRIPAIHDISLVVRQGEIVVIVGANGSGKTTTLRAIAGLKHLTAGRSSSRAVICRRFLRIGAYVWG